MKFVAPLLAVLMIGCLKPQPVVPEPPHVIVVEQVGETPPLVIEPEVVDPGPPLHTWMSEEEVAAWKKERRQREDKCVCLQEGDPICECIEEKD